MASDIQFDIISKIVWLSISGQGFEIQKNCYIFLSMKIFYRPLVKSA